MLIGVFRTEQDAKYALAELWDKPGLVDYPARLLIRPYETGKLHWTEGFAIPKG